LGLEITVSPLVESDIPSILEIESDSQPEPWTEKSFAEEIDKADSRMLVARAVTGPDAGSPSQEIVGYICFWLVAGEIQVLNIAVHKEVRRRGVARKLLELAIRAAREENARTITLEVRKGNPAARKLYETFGFRVIGERPNYYGGPGESAIVMELEVAGGEAKGVS
jgi:ribosomal-protein-alanine N-acetyltransferase